MNPADEPFGAAILAECRRHLRYLRGAESRIPWPLTADLMASPGDELVAALDQFAFRFARLQHTLGQKAFRAIRVGRLLEPYEARPSRDVLGRLEALNLQPSAERWEEIRATRDCLAHDHPELPAQRAARLNLARPMVDEMAAILEVLAVV